MSAHYHLTLKNGNIRINNCWMANEMTAEQPTTAPSSFFWIVVICCSCEDNAKMGHCRIHRKPSLWTSICLSLSSCCFGLYQDERIMLFLLPLASSSC